MSRISSIGAATLIAAASLDAQAPRRPPLRIAAISFASVEVHLNARPRTSAV